MLDALFGEVWAWAERKRDARDWLLAIPVLTALQCACAPEAFVMLLPRMKRLLLHAYLDPVTRLCACVCLQRVLDVYLAKVCLQGGHASGRSGGPLQLRSRAEKRRERS